MTKVTLSARVVTHRKMETSNTHKNGILRLKTKHLPGIYIIILILLLPTPHSSTKYDISAFTNHTMYLKLISYIKYVSQNMFRMKPSPIVTSTRNEYVMKIRQIPRKE